MRYSIRKTIQNMVVVTSSVCLLAACVTNPTAANSPPKPQIEFVDLHGFDNDLSVSLGAKLPHVDVAFYDEVTPNALPVRLQTWMASVESGGGSVKVMPPPPTITAKSPLMLISAISTLWSASTMATEMAQKAQFRTAKTYDAEIKLKLNEKGQSVVEKVTFVQRKAN